MFLLGGRFGQCLCSNIFMLKDVNTLTLKREAILYTLELIERKVCPIFLKTRCGMNENMLQYVRMTIKLVFLEVIECTRTQ